MFFDPNALGTGVMKAVFARKSNVILTGTPDTSPFTLTSKACREMLFTTSLMKIASKNGKRGRNGSRLTREELLAAHERALEKMDRMTPAEGFQLLVKADICTPDGRLTKRYGGRAKNRPLPS